MPYCTVEYYLDDYMGADPDDDIRLRKAIIRASDIIDVLTHYCMVDDRLKEYVPFASQPTFVQTQIKKANSALAEHYILQGGYDATRQASVSMARVGDFQFNASSIEEVPENVIAYLSTTGLLNNRIRLSSDSGLSFTNWWL
jgi:hypothetical protein